MYQLFYILVHKSLFFWSKTETFNALQIVRQLGDIQLLGMLCGCIGLLQFVELKFIHFQTQELVSVRVTLEDILFGIITTKQCPFFQLLNYFIIIGRLFLWDCRRNQITPYIYAFESKIALKRKWKKN